MGVGDLIKLAGDFGPMGLLVAFLVWRDVRSEVKRMAYDQARLDADKSLASALGALTAVVNRLDK